MIYVDIERLVRPEGWEAKAAALLLELQKKPDAERSQFIEDCKVRTWGDPHLLLALRALVGNKCWYSEVPLEGQDPNIDHFRPKGRVREIDDKLLPTKDYLPGYWWWAFEWRNFRLASAHSNQRRVDSLTNGGKADFFPVRGGRAEPNTDYLHCIEDALPIDPCKRTDVALLWFDSDGVPSCSSWRRKKTVADENRVKISIWLYHLDKQEIVQRRRQHMDDIRSDLLNADSDYRLWQSIPGNIISKNNFESKLKTIKKKISDESEFAGAKRAAVYSEAAKYEWLFEFGIV
ncbi:hypothetical protein [Herbaspirillum aquaticum]|uniref:hypothetical protein n=1 Tax=Herbaspirillum aquaticum TaxID=568783 RepID=UPI0024DEE0B7|nr:hypothetical protein [Herbaspirillum aquaticum]